MSASNSRNNSRRIKIKVKKKLKASKATASVNDDGDDVVDDNNNDSNVALSDSAPDVTNNDDDDNNNNNVERRYSTPLLSRSTSSTRSSSNLASRPLFSAASIPMLSSLSETLQRQFAQLEALAEGFQISGWQFVSEQNEVTITRTDNCEPGFTCSRGVTRFETSPDAIYELVSNVDSYRRYFIP